MAQERRKIMVGKVVSDKMMKTVIVEVQSRTRHPLYGKVVTKSRRFKAHNEEPLAKLGDTVKITESRPLSHDKRWRISEIVKRGDVVEAIREVELESLAEKERADREARKQEEQRRAAERLANLAGGPEMVEQQEEEEPEESEEQAEEEEAE